MTKRKYRMEIFEDATVQCLHCGRFFIRKLHHNCTGGYRKHHHKWLELTIESEDQPKKIMMTSEEDYGIKPVKK